MSNEKTYLEQYIEIKKNKNKEISNIYTKYKCEHYEQEIREITYSNESKHYVFQCLKCGSNIKGVKKDLVVGRINSFDIAIQENFTNQQTKEIDYITSEYDKKLKLLEDNNKKEQIKTDKWYHNEYLKSPEWLIKKNKVLLRSQGICEGCRESEAMVVHHLTYEHIGDEFLFELVALCKECHYKIHKKSIDNTKIK